MKRILWLVVTLVFALHARAEHYDVFLLAGQSNMDGRGAAKDLTGPLEQWAKPQGDVLISYSNSGTRGALLASDGFQRLAPGFSVSPGKPAVTALPSRTFGPEVSFGRTLADKLPSGRHVVLIKFCEGGTNLKSQWNPDHRAKLYDQFLGHVRKSLKVLDDCHDTYTLCGMAWHQGESDAGLSAEEYQQLLTHLIEKARADLNAKDLPLVIGEVYDNGKRDTVRAAQRATAKAVPHTAFASCDGLKTFDGGTHFDAAGQIELGRRMAEAMLKLLDGGQ